MNISNTHCSGGDYIEIVSKIHYCVKKDQDKICTETCTKGERLIALKKDKAIKALCEKQKNQKTIKQQAAV